MSSRSRDLLDWIAEGEGATLEFKRKFSTPEKIAREVIAFANSHGGTLMIGVDDDRTIYGVPSEKEEMELLDLACSHYCDPPIVPRVEVTQVNGKYIVVVRVRESNEKPHWLVPQRSTEDRHAFIRVGDQTIAASKEVVKVMRSRRPDAPPVSLSIGRLERALFEYLDTHSTVTVREFKKYVNISERRASGVLVRLVRAQVLYLHTHEKDPYFTLASLPETGR
jgi:hypothetical protein